MKGLYNKYFVFQRYFPRYWLFEERSFKNSVKSSTKLKQQTYKSSNFNFMSMFLPRMLLLITMRLSVLSLVAAIVITIPAVSTLNPVQAQEAQGNEIFTVVVTLYGVNSTTNNVVTFIESNNITAGKVLNATEVDQMDGSNDGIIDVILAFPNVTIPIGEEFRACNMVMTDLSLVCDTGHNSPSIRAEYIDLVLV